MSGPLWMTVQATGRIKRYQVFISFLILANLWISYIFLKLGYRPNIVLWIRLAISLMSFIYRLTYLKKVVSLPIIQFITDVPLNILLVVVISIIIPFFSGKYISTGITGFLASTGISVITAGLTIYFIGLKKNEKIYISAVLKQLKLKHNATSKKNNE